MDYDEEEPVEYENVWGKAVGVDERGRHDTTGSAIDAALKDLLTEKNEFFDSLADRWRILFPKLPAIPGRYEDGKIFIYVKNASLLFFVRPQLKSIKAKLAALPEAPKRIDLRVEIHSDFHY